MQVRLPAATKANTREAGADVKESGLFSGAGCLEDRGLMTQSLSPPLSGGGGFYKEGEGNRTKRSQEGVKVPYVQTSTVHSDKASDGLVCTGLAPHHPAPWSRVSKAPGAQMPEVRVGTF